VVGRLEHDEIIHAELTQAIGSPQSGRSSANDDEPGAQVA